jgi:hypothetical protein
MKATLTLKGALTQLTDGLRLSLAKEMKARTLAWGGDAVAQSKRGAIIRLIERTGWCSNGAGPAFELAQLLTGLDPLQRSTPRRGVCINEPVTASGLWVVGIGTPGLHGSVATPEQIDAYVSAMSTAAVLSLAALFLNEPEPDSSNS